ncbi:hypothetical protein V6N12_044226 [Hibiscus sabdariffa]|uniref:Uncharacterized protein n=1 Tax=Hibiscus sabdariffa TaxID=183260 RepID=A0ABR2DHM5_9ROSI
MGLEQPRSSLVEESQPSSKKGRNLGILTLNEGFANVTDPSGIDGVSMKDAPSFKDKLLCSSSLLGNSIPIDELDVEVVNHRRRIGFPTREADHDNSNTSERIGNGSHFAALNSEVLSDIPEEVCPPLQLNVQKASGFVDHVLVSG